MSAVKLALAQLRMKRGQVERYLKKHLAWAEDARRHGAGLIVFPELSLSGDGLTPDEVLAASVSRDDPTIHVLKRASQGIDLVVGFVEREDGGQRPRFYNASVYFSGGQVRYWHRKLQIVSYAPFTEGKIFTPGDDFACFSTAFGPTSLLICNDAWFGPWSFLAAQYGAGLLLYPSASREGALDQNLDIPATWELINRYHATLYGAYAVFVNFVGQRDGLRYWGGSQVIGPQGEIVARAERFEEELLFADIDPAAVRRQRTVAPLVRDVRSDLLVREFQRWQATSQPI